jgi:DNA-binding NarL/FixJ family response regulator
MAVRVLIADNHPLVRKSLQRLLSREPDMAPQAIVEDRQAIENELIDRHVDVLVLNADIIASADPARHCLNLKQRHGVKVILMSLHTDRRYMEDSFRMGAAGYLVKSSAYEELANAVRCVSRGSRYIGREIDGDRRCRPMVTA